MKLFLTYALVLGLLISAPSPMSLCALASSFVTECATPQTQSQCDRMDMAKESAPKVTAPAASCCVASQAPLPQAKNELSVPAGESGLATATILATEALRLETKNLSDVPQDVSPPPLQPLLCTFLI